MPLLLPSAFLLLQLALCALAPPAISRPAAYLSMVLAPLLAALAVARRGALPGEALRGGYRAVALSLVIFAVGATDNLWQELIRGRQYEMYRLGMLAFNLAAMPTAYVLAGEGRTPTRRVARLIDALVAAALGYGFFLFTWATLTGHPDELSVSIMIWLLDALNAYIALGAIVRTRAASDRAERDLFGVITAYTLPYALVLFLNNHFIAGDPKYGPEHSSIIAVVFAVTAGVALRKPGGPFVPGLEPWVIRTVRSVSPVMLAGGLLILALFMIRIDYPVGVAGVLLAVLAYAARNTLSQVGHIERGETLQTIAHTDALTGVANRRLLEQALADASERGPAAGPCSVLMIDIDHFKLLNDRLGHAAGDACLRAVAAGLQHSLARPGDLLARFGGEEFVALLHGTDAAGAAAVAERLRAAVERLGIAHPASPSGVVTVSVGTATGALPDGLLEAADKALYEAKRAGRNVVRG